MSGSGVMGYVENTRHRCLPAHLPRHQRRGAASGGGPHRRVLPAGGGREHPLRDFRPPWPALRPLFTDLDQLSEGDIFTLRVLDETQTYEVDQIHVVEPDDITQLEIVEGEDLCTLVTCTPYGVNSHRLLVRGHRWRTGRTG